MFYKRLSQTDICYADLEQAKLFPPGLEPGTLRVLGARDNHYTTETFTVWNPMNKRENEFFLSLVFNKCSRSISYKYFPRNTWSLYVSLFDWKVIKM